jgi:hypothetical protein
VTGIPEFTRLKPSFFHNDGGDFRSDASVDVILSERKQLSNLSPALRVDGGCVATLTPLTRNRVYDSKLS